ncbi:YdeI/OmpD-associated family protein [Thermomonas sp.]|uniref:YdeI/OmpD-associated family protein n=1 Tax=Thermomonas sp. TaxID=1971895 RepID=UPI002607445C|nr:YdeI/OmpD-associated family protein [Thermomonas sp.]
MASNDPRVDAYISRQADFARPILEELRRRVHVACPAALETIKWGAPAFTYNDKLLGVMAGFKQHAAFNLWHGKQVVGADAAARDGMGQYGRIAALGDLPAKRETTGHIRAAMALIDAGVSGAGGRKPRPPLPLPDDLAMAMRGNRMARKAWDGFTPGKQREYAEWIIGAKRPETRARRVEQALEWIGEGKPRNWKHQGG